MQHNSEIPNNLSQCAKDAILKQSQCIKDTIYKYKFIVIIRGVQLSLIEPLTKALFKGGVRLIEVTFDQRKGSKGIAETVESIRRITEASHGDIIAGAGTVLTNEQLLAAADAGATYIISPNVNVEIVNKTKEMGLVSIPGAFTPTEISCAYESGADFVKLFPAGSLGIRYAEAVMAPLNHIPMLAVGGVDEKNMMSFLDAGFCGIGAGGGIVNKQLMEEGRFDEITKLAELYTKQLI